MRILRSIHTVNPAGGGPIEAIKQTAAAHATLGHCTEIVSLDAPDEPWVKQCPVRVHALGPGATRYGYTPRFVPWLAAHRREYDAVIVSGLWQYSGFGVWRALAGSATPYFVFPHGMLNPWFKARYPLKHLKKWLSWPWGDYRVLRDARAVLFTSEEERRAARRSFWLYRCHERVVNYGTRGPVGDAAAQRALFARTYPQLAGRRVLLFLGRLHEKKGCAELLTAFAGLKGEWQLVLAGPCAEPRYLEKLRALASAPELRERVTLTGMLEGDLKWGALRSAEVFILPSHQENFGVAVAEALACGTPVLLSNKVNIWREITEAGASLVEEDTVAGTAALLRRWSELPEPERAAMRQAARRCFAERFAIEQAAASLLRALTSSPDAP